MAREIAVTTSSEEIRGVISAPVDAIVAAVRDALDRTPPELASDVMDRGMVLAGGALLRLLDSKTLVSDGGKVDVEPSKDELRRPQLTEWPSWRALQERWNRECECPKWRYGDVRNFHRAYHIVARAIVVPAYDDPEELVLFSRNTLPSGPRIVAGPAS